MPPYVSLRLHLALPCSVYLSSQVYHLSPLASARLLSCPLDCPSALLLLVTCLHLPTLSNSRKGTKLGASEPLSIYPSLYPVMFIHPARYTTLVPWPRHLSFPDYWPVQVPFVFTFPLAALRPSRPRQNNLPPLAQAPLLPSLLARPRPCIFLFTPCSMLCYQSAPQDLRPQSLPSLLVMSSLLCLSIQHGPPPRSIRPPKGSCTRLLRTSVDLRASLHST